MDTATFLISMTLIYAFALITSQVDWKAECSDMIELIKRWKENEI